MYLNENTCNTVMFMRNQRVYNENQLLPFPALQSSFPSLEPLLSPVSWVFFLKHSMHSWISTYL